MESRRADMQAVFNALSEQNKDMILLVAKSVQTAQKAAERSLRPPKSDGVTIIQART